MTVETQSLGDRIAIRIRDNGAGIPDDIRNRRRIFLPFFTTKPAGEGAGLGRRLPTISWSSSTAANCWSIRTGAYTQFTVILPREPAGNPGG